MQIFEDLFLLQRIDHLIRTRATGNPVQLASRLNVSERSLYRLIGELRDQGFPIAYDKKEDTYYYSDSVKMEILISVGSEKLLGIRGGEKTEDFFLGLPNSGSSPFDFCIAI